MFYRENGQFKTSYRSDQQIFAIAQDRWAILALIAFAFIGVGEKLSEVYLGPFVGGGIEIWFAYVLALVFLLFRPQGLFGEKIIDRV